MILRLIQFKRTAFDICIFIFFLYIKNVFTVTFDNLQHRLCKKVLNIILILKNVLIPNFLTVAYIFCVLIQINAQFFSKPNRNIYSAVHNDH